MDSEYNWAEQLPNAYRDIAKVLDFGARKYSPFGFVQEPPLRFAGSCMRHVGNWLKGERFDKESGLPNLAHAIVNLMFLLEKQWKND